jgi:hypothetical protein
MVDISGSERFKKSVQEGYCYGNCCYDGFSATQNNDKIGLILFSDEIELYIPKKRKVSCIAHHSN